LESNAGFGGSGAQLRDSVLLATVAIGCPFPESACP
jgi:hypothetical protein